MNTAKLLQALGIACVMIGLVQGISAGDMWGELYFALGGILAFYVGRLIERKQVKKNASSTPPNESSTTSQQ